MSRAFNGGTSLDMITFGVGAAPPDQGPITMAVLAKASGVSTATAYMVQGVNGTTAVFSELFSNNAGGKLFMEADFGNGAAGISATDWLWYVGTKASGSALPRWHVKNLTTNSAWTHANGTANVGDGSGPITAIRVGSNNAMATTFRGSIAVVALWDTALSDAAVEAACTYAYVDAVVTGAAKWAVKLNQASTATSVTNDAAGGGNQTALAGTTVDATATPDPPGFNYNLTTTITKNLTETYRVLNAVTKDDVETYRVLNSGTKNVSETYRVLNSVTKNAAETYRVFNSVTKNVSETYSILTGFTVNKAETYRVLNAITKDASESYRVFAATTKDVTETYRVLGAVVADRVETYRVFRSVTADRVETYRVLNAATVNLAETYRVFNGGTVNRPETYRVYNAVTKDLTELYSVLSATGVVKNIAETYRVYNAVTKNQTETYRVLGAASKSIAETYRVLNAGTADRPELYRVFGAGSRDLAEAYRIFNGRSRDLAESYNVLGVSLSKDVVERYRVLNARLRDAVERYNVGPLAPITVTIDATARLDLGVRADLSPASAVAILDRLGAVAHLDEVS